MTTYPPPETATERAALIGYLLGMGHRLTVKQVAEMCNISRRGARAMLTRGSRPLPIDRDENGEWRDVHGETEQHVPPDVLP